MAPEVLQACKAFIAGLTGVRPLSRVAAQVTLQIGFPFYRMCAKGTFETHNRVGVCKRGRKNYLLLGYVKNRIIVRSELLSWYYSFNHVFRILCFPKTFL